MRNFGSSFFSDAAALLIKAQGELSRIVDTLPEYYPRHGAQSLESASFELRRDNSTFVGAFKADGTIHLSAEHADLRYQAEFPTRVADIADFSATVTLGKDGREEKIVLNGAQFFSGEGISSDFIEPHNKVMEAAKRYWPGLRGRTGALAREAREAANKAATQQATQAAQSAQATVEEQSPEATSQTSSGQGEPGESGFYDVRVRRHGERDLVFKGELLGGVRSGVALGRGWDYRVYRTAAGRIVAIQTGLSALWGEQDRVTVRVLDNVQDVVEFFGATDLAKALYDHLGIDFEEVLE